MPPKPVSVAGRPRVGVLALQGAVRAHVEALRDVGAEPVEVRLPRDLDGIDGLILPGGESTTMRRLMDRYGLTEPIHGVFIRAPVVTEVGAGVEVLARDAEGHPIAVRSGRVLATAFHPELTGDRRLHRLFVDLIARSAGRAA